MADFRFFNTTATELQFSGKNLNLGEFSKTFRVFLLDPPDNTEAFLLSCTVRHKRSSLIMECKANTSGCKANTSGNEFHETGDTNKMKQPLELTPDLVSDVEEKHRKKENSLKPSDDENCPSNGILTEDTCSSRRKSVNDASIALNDAFYEMASGAEAEKAGNQNQESLEDCGESTEQSKKSPEGDITENFQAPVSEILQNKGFKVEKNALKVSKVANNSDLFLVEAEYDVICISDSSGDELIDEWQELVARQSSKEPSVTNSVLQCEMKKTKESSGGGNDSQTQRYNQNLHVLKNIPTTGVSETKTSQAAFFNGQIDVTLNSQGIHEYYTNAEKKLIRLKLSHGFSLQKAQEAVKKSRPSEKRRNESADSAGQMPLPKRQKLVEHVATIPLSASYKVLIIHALHPTKALSKANLNKIQKSVLNELDNAVNVKESISFYNCNYKDGGLEFICSNNETKNWLIRTIDTLMPFPKGTLKVIEEDQEYICITEIPPRDVLPINQLKLRLERQNVGIATKNWQTLNNGSGNFMFSVDESSKNKIIDQRCKMFLNFGQIDIKIREKDAVVDIPVSNPSVDDINRENKYVQVKKNNHVVKLNQSSSSSNNSPSSKKKSNSRRGRNCRGNNMNNTGQIKNVCSGTSCYNNYQPIDNMNRPSLSPNFNWNANTNSRDYMFSHRNMCPNQIPYTNVNDRWLTQPTYGLNPENPFRRNYQFNSENHEGMSNPIQWF